MSLLPYKQRVIDERDQLSYRLGNLRDFILHNESFAKLPDEDRRLLMEQEKHMTDYFNTIQKRLALWGLE